MSTMVIMIVLLAKKLFTLIILLFFFLKIKNNHRAAKFKIGDRVRITKYKNSFLSIGCIKNWSREIFRIDVVIETRPWRYRIKDSKLLFRTR